jgi:signal transduction histidine kinase
MYKRLVILSLIILAAVCGMGWLGYHSILIWTQGLEGMRIREFAEVAEQIRQDINRKLDAFMEQEQNRPYTDYQYYYVPETVTVGQQQTTIENSPLAGQLEHGLAYYNFQIQPDGRITTPNVLLQQQPQSGTGNQDKLYAEAILNSKNIEDNLLPVLDKVESDPYKLEEKLNSESPARGRSGTTEQTIEPDKTTAKNEEASKGSKSKIQSQRKQSYPIESFKNIDEETQIIRQSREVIASNQLQSQQLTIPENIIANSLAQNRQQQAETQQSEFPAAQIPQQEIQTNVSQNQPIQRTGQQRAVPQPQIPLQQQLSARSSDEEHQENMVEVKIEPFVPVTVPVQNNEQSIFGKQIFMLRRVQIEDKSFLQGFQLNEKKLLEEVEDSTRRYIRDGMSFELAEKPNNQSAYMAILDFGFGHLLLNLMETDPARLDQQTHHLKNWYIGIMSVVFLAVMLAVSSLWYNARAQFKLAQKKDDFISAVSHELRTPLTSIRMHAEMLEKNWIKSQDKFGEYYKNMRSESERLSRLIENVLDFSRIQRGRKKFLFKAGNINQCVEDVVEMMAPYAAQKRFTIQTELGQFGETSFDSDAVTQIVVNLLDNAIKYARNANDKTIKVRTRKDRQFIIIEVEDHGPGVPGRQRDKIFQEFYRIGAEATRETAGSGLGLALVKKFAQAHNGFVEILNAEPTGAIFRVTLTSQMEL